MSDADLIDSVPVLPSNTGSSNNPETKVPSPTIASDGNTAPKVGSNPAEIKESALPDTSKLNQDMLDEADDNASVLVIILQCETRACDANISNLKWAFSDPYFTVQVCAVDPPATIPTSKTFTQTQYLESYNIRKALTYAAEGPYINNAEGSIEPQFWWDKIPVIIIKDSSITNLTPFGWKSLDTLGKSNTEVLDHLGSEEAVIGGMKRRIKIALDRAHQADLFFLCKWNDACDKYIDVEGASSVNHGSSLKWSTQPTATQAIMYSPEGRDFVRGALMKSTVPLSDMLNSHIARGDLLATVFVPNIIDFDIDLATSNEDYAKLNECAPIQPATNSSSSGAALVWLILIMIVVVLVAWALIQLSPNSAPSA